MTKSSGKTYLMHDEPNPFGTLETWERHLAEMKALPETVENRARLITWAEHHIALMKECSLRETTPSGKNEN